MPKGQTPRKRLIRKMGKAKRQGAKALQAALKRPGKMKKLKSFLQPMSKGRGK